MRRILLAGVIALMPLTATAQDFIKGQAAARAGDHETAVKEWRPLAEQGHAGAQYYLGVMYEMGLGVPQDEAEAVRWIRLAAEFGFADAQNHLGAMYARGVGMPKDLVMAHMWSEIASANGSEEGRENSEKAAKLLTPEEASEAQRRAKVCMESNYKDCD